MKTPFDSIILGKIPVKNRVVRSATFETAGDDQGRYGDSVGAIYDSLAKGGVGLLITGMVGVDENAGFGPNMVKAYDSTFPDGLRKLVDVVHASGSRMVVQLAHCGVAAWPAGGLPPFAPSPMPDKDVRTITAQDIGDMVNHFAAAALICRQAGADGVQIHAAHGYLLSQFLSPVFNHRTDQYGGSIENRARAVMEVYDAVRAAVGADYPVWVKINCTDLHEDGLQFEDSLWVCRQLSEAGIDAIEVSGGLFLSRKTSPSQKVQQREEEGYFYEKALAISDAVKADVISVGGFRSVEAMNERLNRGEVKAFGMCRPLICEPDLVARWQSGDLEESKCISCNKCYTPGPFGCRAQVR